MNPVRAASRVRVGGVVLVVLLTGCGVSGSDSGDHASNGTTEEARRKDGGTGGSTSTSTEEMIRSAYATTCPQVAPYTDCAAVTVYVVNQGATGYTATSRPAYKEVTFNSYYTQTSAGWNRTVSHEMGGHHDAWNELVARVGETQAWTDYYDIDYYAEIWAEARFLAVMGTTRDFTSTQGKEAYLDCRGPVAHGYAGAYLTGWGIAAGTAQQQFCQGYTQVFTDAMTKTPPG